MTDWFRSWHGAPTDIKWLAVARRANVAPGMVVSIAWALMDRASQADDRGSIEGYDAEELGIFFGCDPEHVEAVVAAMEARGIVTQGRFTAWERRQPKREDNSSDRVRKFRERQKTAKKKMKRTVTQRNAPEQSRTDTELDCCAATARARAVTEKVCELAGASPVKNPNWMGGQSIITVWLQRGADPELDIYPTVERMMAGRMSRGQDPPSSPKYFTNAIDEARADRERALNAPEPQKPAPDGRTRNTGKGQSGGLPAYLTASGRRSD